MQYSQALIPSKQKIDVICHIKGTNESHAVHTMHVSESVHQNRKVYLFKTQGEGGYNKYKNVRWEKTSRVIDDNGLIRPLESEITIKDQNNNIIVHYSISYNYETKKIKFVIDDREMSKVKTKTFPIKGPVCDDVNMIYFLKAYAANAGEKTHEYFYLLTNEPDMYRVRVKAKEYEVLDLPLGSIDTVKIQAQADFGALTNVIGALFPPTYLWYENQPPYHWVQYEGLDGGPRAENVRAVVQQIE